MQLIVYDTSVSQTRNSLIGVLQILSQTTSINQDVNITVKSLTVIGTVTLFDLVHLNPKNCRALGPRPLWVGAWLTPKNKPPPQDICVTTSNLV